MGCLAASKILAAFSTPTILSTGEWKITGDKSQGLLIGQIENLDADGWERVDEATQLRSAFDIGANEAALVVVDREGRLAFREKGLLRFWQIGQAGRLLGLEGRDMEEREE